MDGKMMRADFGSADKFHDAIATRLRKWNRVRAEFLPGTLAWAAKEFGDGDYSIFADATQGIISISTHEWTKIELASISLGCKGLMDVRMDVAGSDSVLVPWVAVPGDEESLVNSGVLKKAPLEGRAA